MAAPATLGVCVSGALGGVGGALVRAIAAADDLRLHSAVSRSQTGRDVGEALAGERLGVVLESDLAAALDRTPEVLIDYTHPTAIRRNVALALERGIPVVIGTSGLYDDDFAEIDAAARAAGVGVATGNFSLTAELLARERVPLPAEPAIELIGPPEARGASFAGVPVHSVRLPGTSPRVEVIFGAPGERLTICHEEQGDPSIFVAGTLLAARRVQDVTGLVRGLDSLLF